MERAKRAIGPVLPAATIERDQIVVLHGVPWAQYDALCQAREDAAGARMAYLDGELEIMSPSSRHELEKTLIARLLEGFAEERNVSLNGFGSTTYRRKVKEAGLEPDECYCVGAVGKVPDFAIEVVHTGGGIDKLEIYRRLGVREVWYWADRRFQLYRLVNRRYRAVERSAVLAELDLDQVAAIVRKVDESRQMETVRAYRQSLRRRG